MPNIVFPLTTLCQQRHKQMLFNIPLSRYTPISPYLPDNKGIVYTKQQLDMRRKAEILKYSNNTSSTKTNNLTKSQKYAQFSSSNIQTRSYSTISITTYQNNIYTEMHVKYPDLLVITPATNIDANAVGIVGYTGTYIVTTILNGAISACPNDRLIPTPTSASGVPGPIQYLIDDETVPLYNYASNTNSYGLLNTTNTEYWLVNETKNVNILTNTTQPFASMFISNNIQQASYVYSIQVPFSIYCTGSNVTNSLINNYSVFSNFIKNLKVEITNIVFGVTFGEKPVKFITAPTITITTNNQTRSISQSNTYDAMYFDVIFPSVPSSTDTFYSSVYVGTINISNIYLYTSPGMVYDFNLKIDTDLNFNGVNAQQNYNSAISTTNTGCYVNVTQNINNNYNTTVNTSQQPTNIIPFSIKGV